MTKDEALKMAIKEMTDAIPHLDIHFDDYFEAINACKEALKQPEGKEFFERGKEIARWADKQALKQPAQEPDPRQNVQGYINPEGYRKEKNHG